METPKEYHYVYYSYEEYGRGYFGSRTCDCLPEKDVNYFGSYTDKTFKPTRKIILKDDYATREEAYIDEIILQEHYKVVENPHFANRAYQKSKKFYISREQSIKNGKKTVEIHKKNKIGLYGRTQEQIQITASKAGKIGGNKTKELKLGICGLSPEERIENARKGGKIGGNKVKELGIGVCGRSKKQMIEDGRKGGQKTKELGIGLFSLSPEQKSEAARKGSKNTNSQKWRCLETGFITNSGALTSYQRKRGIDTSKRERLN
jgi:general stress protein YciG